MNSLQPAEANDDHLYIIHMGMTERWKETIAPEVKINKEKLPLSISYNVNISLLSTASVGRERAELPIMDKSFINRPNPTKGVLLRPRF